MQEAFLALIIGFLGGALGGTLGRVLVTSWISRRCTNLENAVGDLQQRQSSFKGKEMADKRWTKEKAFTDEMAQVLQSVPAARRKFDNDPLGTE